MPLSRPTYELGQPQAQAHYGFTTVGQIEKSQFNTPKKNFIAPK